MTTLKERLAGIYTPVEGAVMELRRRRAMLSEKPLDDLEMRLSCQPYAVMFRQVATPNFELLRFLSLANKAGLSPLVLEFHQDKFVDCNPDKYALARMTVHDGIGRNGGARNHCITVADVNACNGRSFRESRTVWRQPLIAFHHELLAVGNLSGRVELFESSRWFFSHGGTARDYYADFFALFVDRAILFETFLLTSHEASFTTEIVLPAFESVCSGSGRRPLICRLDPLDAEGAPYWLQYPPELLPVVLAKLNQQLE